MKKLFLSGIWVEVKTKNHLGLCVVCLLIIVNKNSEIISVSAVKGEIFRKEN